MAYLEVRKAGKLVKRRLVEDDRAQKGCRIRVGSAGQVRLRMGESKTLGKYTVSMLEGAPPDDGPDLLNQSEMKSDSFPAMSETEQARFTGPAQVGSHGGQSPTPVIEDYEVTGRLGQGGMGTVWRAVQLSTKREVALKFLGKHRFASKRSRARFEREVSLAAKLTHPNIACVYDSGLHRGVYYYAMELVDGVHLDKYVHQNQLSHREILKLMKDVCNAVGYAHEKGIIHRDLKPSNILVTNDGRPHVVDFGLAKASMDEDDLTISIDGEITGTLAYMSPEQAAGRLDKIGAPTDVYSLGVILHQLLTGRLPHDVTGSRYDVIKRIVEEDVQSPRAHDDSIDGDLESLILAALAQEPEDRYPSAILLLNDIENYLNREPLLARSMSATYRIRKRVRKYATRIARSLLFITILAVVVVSAYYLVSSERKKRFEAEKLLGLRHGQTDASKSSELISNENNLIDGSGEDETGEQIAQQNITAWSPKRAPAPPAIKVEGKPFFVICARSAVPSEYGEYHKAGFNTVSTHDSDNPALDEARNYGLKAISRLPWFKLHSEWGFMKDNVFTEADWETFEQQVEHQSKHPALFAWALPTGVVVHKFSSEDIQRAYNMVKNAAPGKPAFSLFAIGNLTRNPAKPYLQYTDVMFTENANRDLKQFGMNLEKSVTLANGRPAWHVIHGHRGHYGDNQPVTLRSQCYIAVNHGITGIFIDGFKEKLWEEWGESNVRGMGDPGNKDLRDQAKRLAGELSILSEPILASALLDEVAITNDNGNIDFKAYLHPDNKRLYIIAVNTSKTQVKPTFKIPVFVQSRIDLIGEMRQIDPVNGHFSDIFEPFQTHLYVLRTDDVPEPASRTEPNSVQVIRESTGEWIPRRTSAPVAIEVNGKPFFAICARSCEPNDFAEIAKAGFNIVSSHNAANAYLEDAKRYGLRAIAYTGQNPERQALEKRARSLQNDKTLLAWFMPSCPVAHKIHRGKISRTYEQIYTNDKNHPVLIDFVPSLSSWQQVKSYAELCDIVAIEPFIYNQNSSVIRGLDIRDRILAVSHWTEKAKEEVAVDKPLWVLIQAFAGKGGKGMCPTPQQFRTMAYLSINHGATGITVSGFKKRLWEEDGYDVMGLGDPQMYELRQEVLRVAGEIRQLSPAILAGAVLDEVTIKNDNGKIDFKAYVAPDNQRIYLVAVNTSDTEVQPTFFIPNIRGTVHILNEMRGIPRPNGQFTDKFEPYQTHLYVLRTDNVPEPVLRAESNSEQVIRALTEEWIPKRTSPPATIEVNEKPFFVICARSCEPNDFAEVAREGFNTVSYAYRDQAHRYLTEAKKHGLRAIVYSGVPIRETYDRHKCESDVHALRNDSTLLAWGLPVCPIWHNRNLGEMQLAYETIKRVDERHPAFLLFTPRKHIWSLVSSYAENCDVVAIEPSAYLRSDMIGRGLGLRDRILVVSYWTDEAMQLTGFKPVWVFIQAYELNRAKPTATQLRSMVYLAINHGAGGVFIDGYKRRLWKEDLPEDAEGGIGLGDPRLAGLRREAAHVAGEIRQLSPAILSGAVLDEVTITNDSGKIDFKVYAAPDNKKIYLVAVNTSDTEVHPTFFVPNMRGKVHILNESRDFPRPDGQFADKFEAYQTHIYDIRMKQDLLQGSSEKTNLSEIIDPRGNLRGNIQRSYLDIIKASIHVEGNNYVFSMTVADSFPDPNKLEINDTFTLKWFVDIDRNKATGISGSGNDYNIHLWCSNDKGWYSGWLKTLDTIKQEEIKIEKEKITIRIKDNNASLIFPKNYLPSDHFDWWVNTGTRPYKGPSAANNPLSQRHTFTASSSGH